MDFFIGLIGSANGVAMELRHLRYFLAVAEAGNFTRAAEQAYVAQSALSSQIARLEAELGTPLFSRTSRAVRLTPAGELLRPLAAGILAEVEHATAEVAALVGLEKGRLRVGTIQTGASAVDIVALVAAYHERHPGIMLHVRTAASIDLAAAVAGGELDLAIVALPPPALPQALTYHPIVDDPLAAVMSRAVAREGRGEISLAELVGRGPFISYRPGSGLRWSVSDAFDRAGLVLSPSFELDRISDMIRLAALGSGVTLVPQTSTRPIPGEPHHTAEFSAVALSDHRAAHRIGVVYDRGAVAPATAAFLAMVIDRSQRSVPAELRVRHLTAPDLWSVDADNGDHRSGA